MRIYLATLFLAAALPCQGSFATFGAGCSLLGQTPPTIGATGSPDIGQTFAITYSGPNYTGSSAQQVAHPFLALGVQSQIATIPDAGLIYQPNDCTGYILPVSLIPMPVDPTLPSYASSYAMTIPNSPGLIGYQFMAQWLMVHAQCGIAGCGLSALITSDAAVITIG